MLAVNYDDAKFVPYPILAQPKLNGVRAKWDGERLISRQNKLFKECVLPDLYAQLRTFSACYPGVILDGELYTHGLPLQEIIERTAINRIGPHEGADDIGFHAFDIIAEDRADARLQKLAEIYNPRYFVVPTLVDNESACMAYLKMIYELGYEGLILRQPQCPYINGRTEALIKLKPWQYASATVIGFSPGRDKYVGMLGALECRLQSGKTFKVSGGLSDGLRTEIWNCQEKYIGRELSVRFRELSNGGIPLQPQIVLWK